VFDAERSFIVCEGLALGFEEDVGFFKFCGGRDAWRDFSDARRLFLDVGCKGVQVFFNGCFASV